MPAITPRQLPAHWDLPDMPPLLQRIYAARGVTSAKDLDLGLPALLPYQQMKGIRAAVELLLPVVTAGKRLLVVGDFDVDGATSTALAIRALHMLGANDVQYLVPNRFDFGYGLSPELVAVAVTMEPDLIMTVDNGIASVDGVAAAAQAGIPVLVTDHHLPGSTLPEAAAIVNPNQPGCEFPSKAACGCTVVFYLMLALRAEMKVRGLLPDAAPNMAQLLDLVALATVADVVPLDHNNRILVEQGLRRIRAGHASAGVLALLQVAGRESSRVVAADFGFAVGPRLNAAGRLDDMSVGIECLLTGDATRALNLARTLDDMNRERRTIEQGMQEEALKFLSRFDSDQNWPVGVCLYQHDWHQGVIGILASRIKEKVHRPVIAMAAGDDGLLKGSARSIPGLHMRDALDEVDKSAPGLIKKFGGHAMAAGLTLYESALQEFSQRFDEVCRRRLDDTQLQERLETDGSLSAQDFTLQLAHQLKWSGPWGQGFPEPLFSGRFRLVQQRIVGERHLKLVLQPEDSDQALDGIWFNVDTSLWPDQQADYAEVVFQLDVNEFRGRQSVQLMIKALTPTG
ncbi:MAG: single-stranded-DNA-specific exonuclease RecJ [Oceanospirillaceae bacterium]|nr:single-stranded-DNA-specific exonuclease RecJ [Oceanospirillaceae bacterium]MBT13641.1 single-stranded-DNA-specific exonuclease RecJ [Oceanospirillaceae bacterium]|tara:strand:+ start:2712 stop:4424 length:1713 start_codon:yes stop_codon:yes gene_type:complete